MSCSCSAEFDQVQEDVVDLERTIGSLENTMNTIESKVTDVVQCQDIVITNSERIKEIEYQLCDLSDIQSRWNNTDLANNMRTYIEQTVQVTMEKVSKRHRSDLEERRHGTKRSKAVDDGLELMEEKMNVSTNKISLQIHHIQGDLIKLENQQVAFEEHVMKRLDEVAAIRRSGDV
jgi:hypothetical protein